MSENTIIVAVKSIIKFNGRFLIIQRSETDPIQPFMWELVGGKLEFDEELETALKREVMEETGLSVNIVKMLYATTFKTNPYRQLVVICYFCQANSDNVKLSDEHRDFLWVDRKEMLEKLDPDIIKDIDKYNAWVDIDVVVRK